MVRPSSRAASVWDARPMLATPGPLPDGPQWCYEFKWDGVRALVSIRSPEHGAVGGGIRIHSRSGADITATSPEVADLGRELFTRSGGSEVRLDGEIVALGPDGSPSFGALQSRMAVNNERRARKLAETTPAAFLAFDLLVNDGADVTPLPYEARRELLQALPIDVPPSLCAPEFSAADAIAIAREQRLEGVVAKLKGRPYEAGRRSAGWIKMPFRQRQEVVIGGWEPGQHGRAGQLGALLVGVHDGDGALVYAGQVGSGFTARTLADLQSRLAALTTEQSPFADLTGVPARDYQHARWVRPELVAVVEFRQWTTEGRLRAPSFKGLRTDIAPEAVVRDT
jgi:bifunctional non-homologous end joining protein LigD